MNFELSPRMKQALLIGGFVFGLLVLGLLIYWVFFRTTPVETPTNQNTNAVGGLPSINDILSNVNTGNGNQNTNNTNGNVTLPGVDSVARGGQTAVTTLTPDATTKNPAVAPTQQGDAVRYYDSITGKFFSVDSAGNIQQIGTAQFPNVENVTWNKTNNEVILEFPDGANVYYNLSNNKQVTLPKEFEQFDFSNDGAEIAFKYMHQDPERRVLAVSSPDGSKAKTLEALGENEHRVQVGWSPTGKVAATYASYVDVNRQEIGFIGLNKENFKGTVVEGRGFQSEYSADGTRMLYSVYSTASEYKPSLSIVDSDGENIGNNRREIGLNTFAEKCGFSKDSTTLYCGVPSDQKYGYGLEPNILNGIPDDIYKIDLKTGIKTKIATPVNNQGKAVYAVAPKSVTVTKDGQLIFQDSTSGQLVKIRLQ